MPQPRRRQGHDSDEDGDYITHTALSSAGTSGAVRRCKVDGCGVSLEEEKTFFRRARCCQVHARELAVQLGGQAHRICQQCSSFHPITAFDGSRRSCRERLKLHKLRQRELNSRRMAQATAFQAAQEAARAGPMTPAASGVHVPLPTASMLTAVPPDHQLPPTQAATLLAARQLQQQSMAQAEVQHPQMPSMPVQPTMPLIPSQQEVSGGFDTAATAADMPGIFAGLPHELPFDIQPQCQVETVMNWEAQDMSTLWDAPPPASSGCDNRMFKAQSVPLVRSSSKDGLWDGTYGGGASFRSLSAASAGSESNDWQLWWVAATGAALPETLSRLSETNIKPADDMETRRLVGSGGFGRPQHASVVSDCSKDRELWRHWCPFETAPRAPAKRPARDAGLPPLHSIKRASVESAGSRRSNQALVEGGSLEPTLQGSSMLGRGLDGTHTATGMQTAKSGNSCNLAAASWHARLKSQDSRGASSPSRITPPPASNEEPLPFSERRAVSLPLSVWTPLITQLPDIDAGASSRAFQEQAPEPLYLVAQLVGLHRAELPEYSYGRSRGSDANMSAQF